MTSIGSGPVSDLPGFVQLMADTYRFMHFAETMRPGLAGCGSHVVVDDELSEEGSASGESCDDDDGEDDDDADIACDAIFFPQQFSAVRTFERGAWRDWATRVRFAAPVVCQYRHRRGGRRCE